jgi:hypothetical protein
MVNLPLFGAIVRQSGAAPQGTVMDIVRQVAAKRSNAQAYEKAVAEGWDGIRVTEAKAAAAVQPAGGPESDYDLSRSGVTPIEP